MHRRRLLQVIMAVVALMSVMLSGIAANPAYAAGEKTVLLNATFSGSAAFTSATTAVLSGSGNASHMGKTGYFGDVSDITPTADGLTDVLVDTLTILCNQVAVETSPGVFVGTDTWTVIGGTSRFQDATVFGTGTTYVDTNNGIFEKQLDGRISKAKKDK